MDLCWHNSNQCVIMDIQQKKHHQHVGTCPEAGYSEPWDIH